VRVLRFVGERTYVLSDAGEIIPGMGRPVGSKTGRIPEGGYPEVSDELGGFLAGFIEGEACFGIAGQSRGNSHHCSMTLCSRADDAPMMRELVAGTRLGTVQAVPARRTSRPQVRWCIVAKSDCLRLVEILDRHPLRGRKSRDFAIWRAGVRWWADDPAQRRANRDWAPLIYLKDQLHRSKRYDESAGDVVDQGSATGLDPDWRPFLAGFATAEGSLVMNRNRRTRYVPQFRINLRADDLMLLAQLHRRTGTGRLFVYERAGNPVSSWVVSSRDDLGVLVGLFDASRVQGRKAREYLIWGQAVNAYRAGSRGTELRDLSGLLRRERTYRAPCARVEYP
jgi:hypothetical protein